MRTKGLGEDDLALKRQLGAGPLVVPDLRGSEAYRLFVNQYRVPIVQRVRKRLRYHRHRQICGCIHSRGDVACVCDEHADRAGSLAVRQLRIEPASGTAYNLWGVTRDDGDLALDVGRIRERRNVRTKGLGEDDLALKRQLGARRLVVPDV